MCCPPAPRGTCIQVLGSRFRVHEKERRRIEEKERKKKNREKERGRQEEHTRRKKEGDEVRQDQIEDGARGSWNGPCRRCWCRTPTACFGRLSPQGAPASGTEALEQILGGPGLGIRFRVPPHTKHQPPHGEPAFETKGFEQSPRNKGLCLYKQRALFVQSPRLCLYKALETKGFVPGFWGPGFREGSRVQGL